MGRNRDRYKHGKHFAWLNSDLCRIMADYTVSGSSALLRESCTTISGILSDWSLRVLRSFWEGHRKKKRIIWHLRNPPLMVRDESQFTDCNTCIVVWLLPDFQRRFDDTEVCSVAICTRKHDHSVWTKIDQRSLPFVRYKHDHNRVRNIVWVLFWHRDTCCG